MSPQKRRTSPKRSGSDFLLEIGCEELPADYLPALLQENPGAGRGLANATLAVLEEEKIPWECLTVYGSARRLAVWVQGIPSVIKKEVEGPPVSVAFDPKGKPTPAAHGFAKKQGVAAAQLKKKQTSRGERLVLEKKQPADQILSELVPGLLGQIAFPKTMRWEASGVRFARPVRWLLALYGTRALTCSFGTLKSSTTSFVPRRSGGRSVKVVRPAQYAATLKRSQVHLETGVTFKQTRQGIQATPSGWPKRAALLTRLTAAAKKAGGRLPDTTTEEFNQLLSTLTFLSEDPHLLVGSFQKTYLSLPPEVLITSMAKHLKLMSVVAAGGKKLLPKFLAVLEGKPKSPKTVMGNYEKILEARFFDAQFFYQEDTRTSLKEKASILDQLVFHKKLGSVGDRLPRLTRLTDAMAEILNLPAEVAQTARQVAALCKADLVTQMVREFPTLQGTIGGYYAQGSGQPTAVAQGISEHYAPRTALDPIPVTQAGALVSVADRVDTLLGFFAAGIKPTSSLDPYALRRQALGLVRILIEFKGPHTFVGLSIDRLFDVGIQSWSAQKLPQTDTVKRELSLFLRERFEWLAGTRDQIQREVIASVLAVGFDDVADAWQRLETLNRLWTHTKTRTQLIKAAKVAERTSRIVKSQKGESAPGSFDPGVLQEETERQLWSLWEKTAPRLKAQIQDRQYEEATAVYGQLYPALHNFFDSVMVMDDDPVLRRNRLSLMVAIHQGLAETFADLSELPLSGVEL